MQLLANHKNLANCNAEFARQMLDAPNDIRAQIQAIRGGRIPKAYEKLRSTVSPWPVIIGGKTQNELNEVIQNITDLLFKSLVIIAKEYPVLFKKQYDIAIESFNNLDENQPARHTIVGRYDALMNKGSLKLLEFNAGSNIGGWHLYHLETIYRQIVGGTSKLELTQIVDAYLTHTDRMAREQMGDIGRKYNLLFEFKNEQELCEESIIFFTDVIRRLNLNLQIVTDINFAKLQVDVNGVSVNGQPIDIINVPIFNFDTRDSRIQQLSRLHWQNKLLFPDNPLYLSTGHKSCFANLHFLLAQNRLTDAEAQLVNKYIPLTYHLSSKTIAALPTTSQLGRDQLIADKDHWVIKRDGLLGGEHVYIGKFTTSAAWENLVRLAQQGSGWIAQQYYPSDGFYAPTDDGQITQHNYIFGFFSFGGVYGGSGVRLMRSDQGNGVVNSAKGAQYTAVFEVATSATMLL